MRRPDRFIVDDLTGKPKDWNPAYLRHRQLYGHRSASKYTPHQGKRECARRMRQAQRVA